MPTYKQKRAFEKIVENHGNISKTMREVGYSKSSAATPKNLTESDGWKELMEKYLPDKKLANRHNSLLNKKETFMKWNSNKNKWEVIKTKEIDAQAVGKGLDLAYKIKSKYTPLEIKVLDKYENETDEQLDKRIAILEKTINGSSRIKGKEASKNSTNKAKSS